MTREEAIDIIRKNIPHLGIGAAEMTDALEELIPELRESEDERIRKELIEFIKWSVDRHFMREDFHQAKRPSEWIAYLEKQKEPNPAEWSEEDEKIRNLAIEWAETMYGQFRFVDMGSTDFRKIVAWLKSLRPQPQGTYKLIVHNIYEMLKNKDFFDITPDHRVSLLNDIRVRCKNADEQAQILDVPSWKPSIK